MLRFVCTDGVGHGIQILNADTGEDLTKTLGIAYGGQITLGHTVEAKLNLCFLQVDVVAGKTVWGVKHPLLGDYTAVKALELADGTRVEFAEDGTPTILGSAQQPALDVVDAGLGQAERADGAAGIEKSALAQDDRRG